jgi:hypothetical protein
MLLVALLLLAAAGTTAIAQKCQYVSCTTVAGITNCVCY